MGPSKPEVRRSIACICASVFAFCALNTSFTSSKSSVLASSRGANGRTWLNTQRRNPDYRWHLYRSSVTDP
ncbi:hypothetical protein BDZ94DRAFT_1257855 [Collybia nuda]|uniref:Uncharacterized protein n=1 Tax=Collybia nuda TaxID=64659 RepID=A0A9P5Y852_9AGAR|nr:hypothetical protein BDZ94DRAFT_1257855 [Collybia nuda]